jgi:hypothetical protein
MAVIDHLGAGAAGFHVTAINLSPARDRVMIAAHGTHQPAQLLGTVDDAAYATPPAWFPVTEMGAPDMAEIVQVFFALSP